MPRGREKKGGGKGDEVMEQEGKGWREEKYSRGRKWHPTRWNEKWRWCGRRVVKYQERREHKWRGGRKCGRSGKRHGQRVEEKKRRGSLLEGTKWVWGQDSGEERGMCSLCSPRWEPSRQGDKLSGEAGESAATEREHAGIRFVVLRARKAWAKLKYPVRDVWESGSEAVAKEGPKWMKERVAVIRWCYLGMGRCVWHNLKLEIAVSISPHSVAIPAPPITRAA